MAPSTSHATSIRLARSPARLLALPTLALIAGVATFALGVAAVGGPVGVGLSALGIVVVLFALLAAAILLSVRLEVEDAAIRVRRLGGERTYALVPGSVTRVRLRGDHSSTLRASRSPPGAQIGPARLRDDEPIEVVRLAPTATAILVPTDRGRLAIAPADEDELLAALAEAARARRRLADILDDSPAAVTAAGIATPTVPDEEGWVTDPPGRVPYLEAWQPEEPAPVEPEPSFMTGIERAAQEARLAREREEAEERERQEAVAREAALLEAASASSPESAAAAMAEATATPAEAMPAPVAEDAVASTGRRARLARALPIGRPQPSAALVLLPLVGAAAAWGTGAAFGDLPRTNTDVGRLTVLALVLAGPAASIGAVMARVWWPRLVGVVVAGGLAAAVFVGRSLIGG